MLSAVVMPATSHEATESSLRSLIAAGRQQDATTLAIRAYGPELLAFLHSRLRDLEHAREAFAWLAEDLWRGMQGFEGRSTIRTWAYAIARNAAYRYSDRELRARQREIPISKVSRASALAVPLPSNSEQVERITRIRAQLDEEEQTLLTMRVDKGMDWREVAWVFLYTDSQVIAEPALAREAARLRKRFQLLKDKLRKLASELAD
jgi:RNA polymerase sigma-70 factor (ECF subfamily)